MNSFEMIRLLVAAIATLTLAGCDGGFFLDARVVDSEGKPVPGAKVHASSKKSPDPFASISNQNGCVSLGGLVAPRKFDFIVVVEASGYKKLTFSASTGDDNSFQFVLAKKEQAFTSQAQPISESRIRTDCGAT